MSEQYHHQAHHHGTGHGDLSARQHGHAHSHGHHHHHSHGEVGGNILVAFLLNISFSIIEFIGGALTNSVAIISDAIHDLGDASVIGISYFLERYSKKDTDSTHSYGYRRYSLLGGLITTCVLLVGSGLVIATAAPRLLSPEEVDNDGVLLLAVFGVIVNGFAAWKTSRGHSINQRAVSLHMLEDVLGWAAVLVGAFIMKFTGWYVIDPLLSICIAVFIAVNAVRNLVAIIPVFMERVPKDFPVDEMMAAVVGGVPGVESVHHVHVWNLDEDTVVSTMHVVKAIGFAGDDQGLKEGIREVLEGYGIAHSTLEVEEPGEECDGSCSLCPCVKSGPSSPDSCPEDDGSGETAVRAATG